jgi:hypothetical protein
VSINGLLRFNLNSLPPVSSTQITKATLFIYIKSLSSAGTLLVSPINTNWAENTVTTGTAPTLGASISTSTTLASTDVNTYANKIYGPKTITGWSINAKLSKMQKRKM